LIIVTGTLKRLVTKHPTKGKLNESSDSGFKFLLFVKLQLMPVLLQLKMVRSNLALKMHCPDQTFSPILVPIKVNL
jgi:hypothetical protein